MATSTRQKAKVKVNTSNEGSQQPSAPQPSTSSAASTAPVAALAIPAGQSCQGLKRKHDEEPERRRLVSPDLNAYEDDTVTDPADNLSDGENPDSEQNALNNDNLSVSDFDGDGSIMSDVPGGLGLSPPQDPPLDDTDPNEFGCEDILNDFIQENYGTKKIEDHIAPPVSQLLASTIDSWCLQPPTKEVIKTAFEQCKIPSNIIALGSIPINDIIYQRLPFKAKGDKQARSQSNYYTRAMGPLAYIWDCLIKAEAWALKTKSAPPALRVQPGMIPLRDLISCLSASMKLLCLNVSINLHRRKSALHPHLDHKYSSLAGPNNPITKYLFGDNLEQRVSDIFKVSQAARNPRFNAVRARGWFCQSNFRQRCFQRKNYTQNNPQHRSRGGNPRCTTSTFNTNFNCGHNNRFRQGFRRCQTQT